ncbi:MAG: formate/nitrite transporter family protein [Tepidisphaerales bacterium]
MYADTIRAMSDQAELKLEHQNRSLLGHLVRSMAAGMYVGAAIGLIMTVGGLLARDSPGLVRMLMGVCFGGALTIVIFAGSELFTGSNLVLTLGVLNRRVTWSGLVSNWAWTWVGNLLGSVLLAYLIVQSGVMSTDPVKGFVLKVTETKMNLPPGHLFVRAILANWLVCLGVWMAARIKSEPAKILMIWWCMFTFITCGYEHSIANMTTLMMGYLLPHDPAAAISLGGYTYNILVATAGNVVGGAVFVGGLYWVGSARPRAEAPAAAAAVETLAGSGAGVAPA